MMIAMPDELMGLSIRAAVSERLFLSSSAAAALSTSSVVCALQHVADNFSCSSSTLAVNSRDVDGSAAVTSLITLLLRNFGDSAMGAEQRR